MYYSKVNPIAVKDKTKAIKRARRCCDQWCKESSGKSSKRRPHVKLRLLKDSRGRERKVFLHRFWEHIRSKEKHDTAKRARLLPCVRDLLENVEEKPVEKDKTYIFQGKTPGGEGFTVVIKEQSGRLYLTTCYPTWK